jgi:hypothetical protein
VVFIEDPLANSTASLNFTTVALEEGTTFIFSSWVCIANGAGDFRRHLIDTGEPEASAPTSHRDIDDLIEDLDEIQLSDLIKSTSSTNNLDSSPTRVAATIPAMWLHSSSCHDTIVTSPPLLLPTSTTRLDWKLVGTDFTPSTTSQNQLRLVGFINKPLQHHR